jgi:hypothetical protein
MQSSALNQGPNNGVFVVELGLPVLQILPLHGPQALQVVIAVGDLCADEGEGARALMAGKWVHPIGPVKLLACKARAVTLVKTRTSEANISKFHKLLQIPSNISKLKPFSVEHLAPDFSII